ncbi:MAG TPA: NAD-dependent epimerase/dehydratase family protein [Vicinamibacterales bacterium]|nr:NAD-dependent epimerase/dehydratase family protein [Vicinamibacterales bacterium]
MRAFVTGGAGFIGSHLVDRLAASGYSVVVFDNFSTGRRDFLDGARDRCRIIEGDVLDRVRLGAAMAGTDVVFHLAANADVRFGTHHPEKDLQQNTVGTFNVLSAMREAGVQRLVFTSTGSVYGEPSVFPTPEDAPFPTQTSFYGASKLAGEGLISAFCEAYGFQAHIFRLVSVLGERNTHGHVFDFCRALLTDPSQLRVLGNGRQRKSYVYVHDCIDAILLALDRPSRRLNIFNVGTTEHAEVNDSVRWISDRLDVKPAIEYSGGARGWVGDSPFIFLDTSKLRALGWVPRVSIKDAVIKTVDYLVEQRHLLDSRP